MKQVLVVDDKLENRYLLRALLQAHGFHVTEADNGAKALEAAKQQLPDLVISDLLMPEMDGYTLLRHWKSDERLRGIPFIVYTATYTEPKDEKLALDLGADRFIVKPAEPEPFMREVNAVLARAEAGELTAHAPIIDEEEAYKTYSEVLVKKLEKKSAQLEQRVRELADSEEHIKRLNGLYAALSETNQAIVHFTEREPLFQAVCRTAVERGGLSLAWIGWLDVNTGAIEPIAWAGASRTWFERVRQFSTRGARSAPAEIALAEKQIYLCNDLLTAERHAPLHESLRAAGLRSAAALPLVLGGHVVAVLTLFSSEADFFDERLMSLVIEMASDLSFALENFEREDLRRQANAELQLGYQQLESKVAARTSELATANKELEAYAYTVSHDLRAPLRAIDGFTRVVLKQHAGSLDDSGRALLGRVVSAAGKMGTLIDDLLQLSTVSRQVLQLADVDLGALAREILSEQQAATAASKCRDIVGDDLRARGDARLLRMLLQNLLENAVKYSGKSAQPVIEFGCQQGSAETVYFVRDNGVGFDAKLAERMFQPFQRFHHPEDFEGTGIGLATAARVVARHGGRIWAESSPGRGATFYFTLAAQP